MKALITALFIYSTPQNSFRRCPNICKQFLKSLFTGESNKSLEEAVRNYSHKHVILKSFTRRSGLRFITEGTSAQEHCRRAHGSTEEQRDLTP